MLFKSPKLSTEYGSLHPALRKVLAELDAQLAAWELPGLTITEALRTRDGQEALYWKRLRTPAMTEDKARRLARERFSWHLIGAAADFRNSMYSPAERRQIARWLRTRCPAPAWEVLEHDVGRGDHFHLGIRDFVWRKARTA